MAMSHGCYMREKEIEIGWVVRMIFIVIGAVMFMIALLARSFLMPINDYFIGPKIERCKGIVVDVNKYKYGGNQSVTAPPGTAMSCDIWYTVDVDGDETEFLSHDINLYDHINVNSEVNLFRYEGKYALTKDELLTPDAQKIALNYITGIGAAIAILAIIPWGKESHNEVNNTDIWV